MSKQEESLFIGRVLLGSTAAMAESACLLAFTSRRPTHYEWRGWLLRAHCPLACMHSRSHGAMKAHELAALGPNWRVESIEASAL